MNHEQITHFQQRFGQWLWKVSNYLTFIGVQVPLFDHCEENLVAFQAELDAKDYALWLRDNYGKE